MHVVRLPDVGEGVVQAELVEWLVEVGDSVTPESALAEVLTDKASVEISSPVSGSVAYRNGDPGDMLAVGADLVGIELNVDATASGAPTSPNPPMTSPPITPPPLTTSPVAATPVPAAPDQADPRSPRVQGSRPLASPAVRRSALERGIDIRVVQGSGPGGRVLRVDLDTFEVGGQRREHAGARTGMAHTSIRGLRRAIAARMNESWRTPHITYVDEVDLTEVEKLRATLNGRAIDTAHLTVLPFVVRALVIACADHPLMSSTFDAESGTLTTYDAVHVGIATQTDAGLVVPVVRHAEALSMAALATEITRVTTVARAGRAAREDLLGSTVTVTSLGKLGGLATTPILNYPEVAIMGVNRLEVRPVWNGTSFVPRSMMNLSSSFDHRVVDGWDAAVFVQRIKELLEMPALLFLLESVA
jgi:2-oxoisovalerate dehydrogenase E2 component (dihydrolipoyl transacylase)